MDPPVELELQMAAYHLKRVEEELAHTKEQLSQTQEAVIIEQQVRQEDIELRSRLKNSLATEEGRAASAIARAQASEVKAATTAGENQRLKAAIALAEHRLAE